MFLTPSQVVSWNPTSGQPQGVGDSGVRITFKGFSHLYTNSMCFMTSSKVVFPPKLLAVKIIHLLAISLVSSDLKHWLTVNARLIPGT